MVRKITLFLFILITPILSNAASGIWGRFVILNFGTTNYVDGSQFNNQNLGTYSNTANFLLKGGQIKTFKNGSDNVTGATMYYRIKQNGTPGGAFTSINLPFGANLPAPGDQLWENNSQNILITQGLSNGYYDIDVYYESTFTFGSGSSGLHIDNNNGTNYTAHFTINSNLNCAFNLGNDTIICGSNPFQINGPNFSGATYLWSNNSTAQNISISSNGTYSLTISNGGCVFSDSVKVSFLSQQPFSLGNDVASCGAAGVLLNSGYTLSPDDDSLTIIYDATQGVTQLLNSGRVYFHSTVKLVGNNLFNTSWVGNWGQNDGIGQMDSLGNNLWRIKLNPKSYYGLNGTFQIDSLQMVFRNANGSAVGKDSFGQDIKADYGTILTNASSNFIGVNFNKKAGTAQSILWSTGATTSGINVTTTGTYTVNITSACGYIYKDTVNVTQGSIPLVNAGSNQAICPGQSATFTAPSGFASYSWSNGATTQSITTNIDGDYILTATDNNGCSGIDLVNLTTTTEPTTSINAVINNATVTFTAVCNMANATYKWDFTNNGTIDSQQGPTVVNTYSQNGFYTVKLITTVSCGDDTATRQVNINFSGVEDLVNASFNVYPNPFNDFITIESKENNKIDRIEMINTIGQTVVAENNISSSSRINIETAQLSKGIYFIKVYNKEGVVTKKLIKK